MVQPASTAYLAVCDSRRVLDRQDKEQRNLLAPCQLRLAQPNESSWGAFNLEQLAFEAMTTEGSVRDNLDEAPLFVPQITRMNLQIVQ